MSVCLGAYKYTTCPQEPMETGLGSPGTGDLGNYEPLCGWTLGIEPGSSARAVRSQRLGHLASRRTCHHLEKQSAVHRWSGAVPFCFNENKEEKVENTLTTP